mmetsp:Transcript_71119/g.126060  ORF Transcript_71119/g.126060 Transcript_71119/m.126060 type:complete len:544 (-) Transcript_71119:39-1670(-)
MAPTPDGGSALLREMYGEDPAAPKSQSKAARRANSKQRRKVEKDLRARKIHNKDVFSLQQRLLLPGAGSALMDAARGLFQADDYQAVVEERALETLCGFPPCTNSSVGSGDAKKKWSIKSSKCEVFSAKDVGNFCSVECMRQSGAFELRLEPEPAYVRSAAAVAASRGAVAEAEVTAEANGKSATTTEGKRPLPKVRQKAVVRFSRSDHTYTVHYDEYDGGGALPGVASTDDPARVNPKESVFTKRSPGGIRGMLNAQVSERQAEDNLAATLAPETAAASLAATLASETAAASSGSILSDETQPSKETGSVTERSGPTCSTIQGASSDDAGECADKAAGKDAAEEAGTKSPGDAEDLSEADDDGKGFFDADGIDTAAHERCVESGFVRAWGVLTSWLTESAQRTIHGGTVPEIHPQDDRPDFAVRRTLLNEMLTQRVPGDLAALAPRLSEVVASLGIHQALPAVTESDLYDLLGSLLLRVLLQAEVARGSCGASTATRGKELLTQKVKQAAKNLRMTAGELAVLEAHLDNQGKAGYVPIRSAA